MPLAAFPFPETPKDAVSTNAMELRGRPARTAIPLGAMERRNLIRSATEPWTHSLIFEDIRYDRNPGVYYEVYLGLPEGETPDPRGRYYAGKLAVSDLNSHDNRWPLLSLDVTRTIRWLRKAGRLASGDLPVSFVPRGMTPPGGSEAAPEAVPPLGFERIRLSTNYPRIHGAPAMVVGGGGEPGRPGESVKSPADVGKQGEGPQAGAPAPGHGGEPGAPDPRPR